MTEKHPDVAVVMLTQHETIDSAVQATRMKAADYITKPFHVEELRARPGFGGPISMSPRTERVYKMIEKVSRREHAVLILGDSGTGKKLVARSIHLSGPRKNKPFVPVECSALVSMLVESELFGYTKGAFTGALQAKQELMEAANGGTLFLDEIGEMSPF